MIIAIAVTTLMAIGLGWFCMLGLNFFLKEFLAPISQKTAIAYMLWAMLLAGITALRGWGVLTVPYKVLLGAALVLLGMVILHHFVALLRRKPTGETS